MGDEIFNRIAGTVVIDERCVEGTDAVDMARRGAKRVIGIDLREDALQIARQKAMSAGVQNTCLFVS
jgi:2-polyprenyl-3-methyl-5-hydroxy-6-metoxy-1,4-benzoquinol methylase